MLASSGSVPSSQAAVIATYWTTGYVTMILKSNSITTVARLRYSAGCAYIAATSACVSFSLRGYNKLTDHFVF